eukprot:2300663-Rhodomonas_salina.2
MRRNDRPRVSERVHQRWYCSFSHDRGSIGQNLARQANKLLESAAGRERVDNAKADGRVTVDSACAKGVGDVLVQCFSARYSRWNPWADVSRSPCHGMKTQEGELQRYASGRTRRHV